MSHGQRQFASRRNMELKLTGGYLAEELSSRFFISDRGQKGLQLKRTRNKPLIHKHPAYKRESLPLQIIKCKVAVR